jgi:malate synthase
MCRRVEITGPVDRKMVINALNSGANAFMADFEDASTPTWANLIDGHVNLRDANAGTIAFTDPKTGKAYKLAPKHAVLFVRPRGFALPEKHLSVDGTAMSGAFFDFVEVDEGFVGDHAGEGEPVERGIGVVVVAAAEVAVIFDGEHLFEDDEAVEDGGAAA